MGNNRKSVLRNGFHTPLPPENVCSLEVSRDLYEHGIVVWSGQYWYETPEGWVLNRRYFTWRYPAPSQGELDAILPEHVEFETVTYVRGRALYGRSRGEAYYATPLSLECVPDSYDPNSLLLEALIRQKKLISFRYEDNPADASGRLAIWLVEKCLWTPPPRPKRRI